MIFCHVFANYTNKKEIVRVLKDAELKGENTKTQIQHIENIQDMLGNDWIFH